MILLCGPVKQSPFPPQYMMCTIICASPEGVSPGFAGKDCGSDRRGISETYVRGLRLRWKGYLRDLRTRIAARIKRVSPRPASGDCYPNRRGISEACEDCGPACDEGMDSINGVDRSGLEVRLGRVNYLWLDPSVKVRRQPTITRCSHEVRWKTFGKCSFYRGDSTEFSVEVKLGILWIGFRRAFWSFVPGTCQVSDTHRVQPGFQSGI
ncbi:hypothetical protein L3X38_017285 [Prunus dulcis]|uniref:Uncharacterized protein n=1 Tax=Prunus dulcis TaxID=3755 RepID=A0AAD4W8I2_PRUDU|nr:hypothetical protein L3X38_017285 [Prunus dulcis]